MEKRDSRFYWTLLVICVLVPVFCAGIFIKVIMPGFNDEPSPQPTPTVLAEIVPQPERYYSPNFIFYEDWAENEKALAELAEDAGAVEYDFEGFRNLGSFSLEEKEIIREIAFKNLYSFKIYPSENGRFEIFLDPRKMYSLMIQICPDPRLFPGICYYLNS